MLVKFIGEHTMKVGDSVVVNHKNGELQVDNLKAKSKPLGRNQYDGVVKDVSTDGVTISIELYAHLHGHSEYSLLDGTSKLKDYARLTTHTSALTDHGNLYGMVEFYKVMTKAGKKPIIAFEAYVEDPINAKLDGMHTCFFAMNDVGYKNLLKLCSEAYNAMYRGKPHLTGAIMEKYHEGIIVSSACLGGPIPQYLLKGKFDEAELILKYYTKIFGKENFYLEVQRHRIPDEKVVEAGLIKLSEKHDIPIICTTDSHYSYKEDKEAHEVMLCLQTGKTINEPHMQFEGDGYWIHTSEEVEDLFYDHPEWLENTLRLAERCDVKVPLGDVNLPKFDIPAPFESPEAYFDYLCEKGYDERFGGSNKHDDPVYRERYDYELAMIKQMGFVSYFLIVQDYIAWARAHDIYVGPGRGSAAGSLIAYCIGITDLDPIELNLLFERFLNPERVSMPDVDTDFEHSKREQVIDYVKAKYGVDSVCRIVTFGTLAAKMALKDVARALGNPPSVGMELAKMVPDENKITLKKALEMNPEFKGRYESEPNIKKIVDIAMAIEGCKRHASQHACGLVIAPGDVNNFLPTSLVKNDETGEKDITSQAVMTEVEELSLLKMDFLGLKNMSVIHEVMDTIHKTREYKEDGSGSSKVPLPDKYQDIPLVDRTTYKFLSEGNTAGVFQLESPGMTDVVVRMLQNIDSTPEKELMQGFENLIAAVALYRPGPMDYIDDYIAGSRASVLHYDTPEEEDLLKSTYGVIVYQEQVMQIVQKLAGFSLGRADVVRKAMGKKKQDIMDAEKEVFIFGNQEAFDSGKDAKLVPGCVKRGIPEEIAREIWAKMENFAKYAFNRSHAACYAYIAYLTAYMSCHWPEEFYCGMLNAFIDVNDKMRAYLNQASRRGIKILPPDINKSSDTFSVERCDDGSLAIRYGMKGLMGVGKVSAEIVQARSDEPFEDFQEFYERCRKLDVKLNKGALESLIYAGAMDSFNITKKCMVMGIEVLEASYKKTAKNIEGQISIFDLPENKHLGGIDFTFGLSGAQAEFPERILMEKEKTAIGFYLTKHPMDGLNAFILTLNDRDYLDVATLSSMEESRRNTKSCGIIKNLKQRFTKKGDEMYSFDLEDKFGEIKCVVFHDHVEAVKPLLVEGSIVMVTGDFRPDPNWGNQIIVSAAIPEGQIGNRNAAKSITVEVTDKEGQEFVLDLIKANPGDVEVYIFAKGKKYSLNKYGKLKLTPTIMDKLKELLKVT